MRRTRDRRPGTLFRGSELTRLMTMVVMLGVLFMLFGLARDKKTWRWIAPGELPEASDVERPAISAKEVSPGGPTDLDADERDAAREELGAVTDKTPLGKEEMPAYWRLMAWERHQSTAALRERAAKNVSFRDLWHQPDKWRGRLVEIPMHLGRTAKVPELAENDLGLKSMNEVWGWSSDSQPYWYWLVCPDLPPGMPQGTIQEEVTFVGYFLKLLPYEDHQGKTLATPLLIGTLVWHPAGPNPLQQSDEWTWFAWPAGIVCAVVLFLRAGASIVLGRRKARRSELPSGADERTVENWLEHATEQSSTNSDGDTAGGIESRGSAGPPFEER